MVRASPCRSANQRVCHLASCATYATRAALQAEILALRHQLLVIQRSSRGHRLRWSRADRFLWVWLARLWSGWRWALLIVKPETVIAWHRKGFRLYWKWKSRHREGRPSVSVEVIDLRTLASTPTDSSQAN